MTTNTNAALREKLIDLIAEHLSGTYHCTRVWEAWNVGTMSQDDFEDVGESDTPAELADAILAEISTAAQPPAAPQEELHEYEWAMYEMRGHRPSDKDNWHAGGTATTQAEAEREAAHYLGQYANDDTGFRFEVFEVTRKSLGGLARLPDA